MENKKVKKFNARKANAFKHALRASKKATGSNSITPDSFYDIFGKAMSSETKPINKIVQESIDKNFPGAALETKRGAYQSDHERGLDALVVYCIKNGLYSNNNLIQLSIIINKQLLKQSKK